MLMTLLCIVRNRKTLFKSRVFGTIFSCTFLSAAFFVCQMYRATMVQRMLYEGDPSLLLQYFQLQEDYQSIHELANESERTTGDAVEKVFGACLMVKDDEALLYEWLAYHYTVLPLGFVVIGSDIDNRHDPREVLNRWTDAGIRDLKHIVLEPDDFIHRHGNYSEAFGDSDGDAIPQDNAVRKERHHHALIHRQKGFLTRCSEILQKHNIGWTVYIDTDEFVALHPMTAEDDFLEIGGKGHMSISNASHFARTHVLRPATAETRTLIDILSDLQMDHHNTVVNECYTAPRLLVGALENKSCSEEYNVERVRNLARSQLGGDDRVDQLSTLRFFQHAKKGDFQASKFGKVLMDLSRIPRTTVASDLPRNIHRPYAHHCGPASTHFPNAVVYLLHYIGSWERYAGRSDERRSRAEWEERASVQAGCTAACAAALWYPRFVEKVGGAIVAKSLLGA